MVGQILTLDCFCCKCYSYPGDDEYDEEMEDDEGEGKVSNCATAAAADYIKF